MISCNQGDTTASNMVREILATAIRVWCISDDETIIKRLRSILHSVVAMSDFVVFADIESIPKHHNARPDIIFAQCDDWDLRDTLLKLQGNMRVSVVAIVPDDADDLDHMLILYGLVDCILHQEIKVRTLKRVLRHGIQTNLITKIQATEQRLRESQHLVERIFETLPYAVNLFDIEARTYLYGNYRLPEKLGYTVDEIATMDNEITPLDIHPDDRANYKKFREDIINASDEDVLHLEIRLKNKAESWRWMHSRYTIFKRDNAGKPIQLLGVAQDITDRKLLEDAIRASEARYHAIINSQAVMLFRYDIASHQITFTNAAFDAAAIVKKSAFLDEIPKSLQQHIQHIIAQQNIGHSVKVTEHELRADVWLECTWQPIVDEANHLIEIQCALYDVSTRKRAERALQLSLLRETEMNAMRQNFIQTISHEFRTPLAGIQLAVNNLIRYHDRYTPDQRDNKFDKVQRYINRMVTMLDDVLIVSQSDNNQLTFTPKSHNVTALVKQSIQTFLGTFSQQARITLDAPTDAFMADVDDRLFTYIVDNLLNNALKYSAEESTVRVVVTYTEGDFSVQVTDKGIGIPDDEIQQVLLAFHRAKNVNEREGTGLGLYIVNHAVQLHNGTLTIHSEECKGTQVTITLPRKVIRTAPNLTRQ